MKISEQWFDARIMGFGKFGESENSGYKLKFSDESSLGVLGKYDSESYLIPISFIQKWKPLKIIFQKNDRIEVYDQSKDKGGEWLDATVVRFRVDKTEIHYTLKFTKGRSAQYMYSEKEFKKMKPRKRLFSQDDRIQIKIGGETIGGETKFEFYDAIFLGTHKNDIGIELKFSPKKDPPKNFKQDAIVPFDVFNEWNPEKQFKENDLFRVLNTDIDFYELDGKKTTTRKISETDYLAVVKVDENTGWIRVNRESKDDWEEGDCLIHSKDFWSLQSLSEKDITEFLKTKEGKDHVNFFLEAEYPVTYKTYLCGFTKTNDIECRTVVKESKEYENLKWYKERSQYMRCVMNYFGIIIIILAALELAGYDLCYAPEIFVAIEAIMFLFWLFFRYQYTTVCCACCNKNN